MTLRPSERAMQNVRRADNRSGSPLQVIVVGGVAGGMSAATRLRRLDEVCLLYTSPSPRD